MYEYSEIRYFPWNKRNIFVIYSSSREEGHLPEMKETKRLTFSTTIPWAMSKTGEKDDTNIPKKYLTHEEERSTPD